MKTFILNIDAKYNMMVILANSEKEAIKIATSKDVNVNPLYSCRKENICEIHEVVPNKVGIQYYG